MSILAPSAAAPPRVAQDAPAIAVAIRGLTKRFPIARTWREILRAPRGGARTTVVDGIDLNIARGEFFGLLGPNGAGKTTLFKMLSTLVEPDEGTADVEGLDIRGQRSQIRNVLTPVIPEERSVNWRLSARENLVLYAALHNLRGAALHRRVDEVLDVVELADTGAKMVGRFSSGMRQRLLIARALLGRPRVLLLDEPTRSLDPLSARRFRDFLRAEIVGALGCTVLLATHNAEEALELCDRVGILDRGRLVAVGPAAELARRTGDPRYRLLTRAPLSPAIDELGRDGLISEIEIGHEDQNGWVMLSMNVAGGEESAAAVVARLAAAGVAIARFEHVPLTLADLIERIVSTDAADRQRRGTDRV